MRVITGTAKGKKLHTLEGIDVRPTTERVKEAVFSAIQFEVEGSTVLDLFAGSGQLGIEALSRGAAKAYFVDSSANSLNVVRKNLAETKLEKNSVAVQMSAHAFVSGTGARFDIAFLDPPYDSQLIQEILPGLVEKMNPSGTIICEVREGKSLPSEVGEFVVSKSYRYGKINIVMYRNINYI